MSFLVRTEIRASKNIRVAIGVVVLSGVVVAGHLIKGLDYSQVENGIRNALHFVVFAAFAAVIFEALRFLGSPISIVATLVIISVVGGLSELLQYSTGRQFDFIDLIRDISGAALALCSRTLWQLSHGQGNSGFSRYAMKTVSVLVGVLILAPLVYWLTVVALSRSAFPTILSFDNWWERHLYFAVNANITETITTNDMRAGKGRAISIELSGWGRSGIGIFPKAFDWTDYNYLTFVASMLSGADANVTVRINDSTRLHQFADRFIAKITVTPQPAVIRIPLEELVTEPGLATMDLSDIREIVIFARDQRSGSVLMLDEIRVE